VATVQATLENPAGGPLPTSVPALYERLLTRPDGWRVYADTLPVLRDMKATGVPVVGVSNAGFDLRPSGLQPRHRRAGRRVRPLVRGGPLHPEPKIFRAACDPVDAGAVATGCLILPVNPPGAEHGLGAVPNLVP
jgi:hypothetical protein